jgi:hypothetical protein
MTTLQTSETMTDYMRLRPRRACTVHTADKIRRVLEWESLSNSSVVIQNIAAQIDKEFATELSSGVVKVEDVQDFEDESDEECDEEFEETSECDGDDNTNDITGATHMYFATGDADHMNLVEESRPGKLDCNFVNTIDESRTDIEREIQDFFTTTDNVINGHDVETYEPLSNAAIETTHVGDSDIPTLPNTSMGAAEMDGVISDALCDSMESARGDDSSSEYDSSFVSTDDEYTSEEIDWQPPLKRRRCDE